MTLFPFEFRATSPVLERMIGGLWPTAAPPINEVVANVVLFVPFGVLLSGPWQRRHGGWRLVAIVCGAGLLMSVAIEALQIFLPRRDPTIVDVVSNTAGAWCGAIVQCAWGTYASVQLARWRAHASTAKLVGLLTGFAILTSFTAGSLQRQARLSNWNASFPLQVGNERTGDRPWRGRVFAFELTDAASSAESIRLFAAGGSFDLAGTPVARFEFSGVAPYRDAAGQVPHLEWTEAPIEFHTDGLRLRGRPWLQTGGPVPVMAQRLGASNAFSLRIQCASDDMNQGGPARILSNSVDFNQRNLMVGQQDQDLIVRIRTPHTGANGSKPQFVIPGVFSNLEPRDILITYDGATVLAAVAGSNRGHRIPLSPGPILTRGLMSLEIETDEHQRLERMYLGVLFIVPAVLVGVLKEAPRDRLVVGGVWVLVFAVLFEGTLAVASGRMFSWSSVALTAVIGMPVMALVAFVHSERPVRERE